MARCRIGEKKVRLLRQKTGLPVVTALTRGNTEHRIDLCLADGTVTSLYRDGTLEKSPFGWSICGWEEEIKKLKKT